MILKAETDGINLYDVILRKYSEVELNILKIVRNECCFKEQFEKCKKNLRRTFSVLHFTMLVQ